MLVHLPRPAHVDHHRLIHTGRTSIPHNTQLMDKEIMDIVIMDSSIQPTNSILGYW